MKLSNLSKLMIVVFTFTLILSGTMISFSIFNGVRGGYVRMQSSGMESPDDSSIGKGDFIRVNPVDDISDFRTYAGSNDTGYRRAGSFGDVISYFPNGNRGKTPILHRAVLYIEFNGTDLDWENGSNGGFDIPLTGEKNLKGKFRINEYEWSGEMKGQDLVIDLDFILRQFQKKGITPHGGLITKGDDNPGVDQIAFFSNSGWIEPVKEDWIVGKFAYKVQYDPVCVFCCLSNILVPVMMTMTIVVIIKDNKREEKVSSKVPDERRRRRSGPGKMPGSVRRSARIGGERRRIER